MPYKSIAIQYAAVVALTLSTAFLTASSHAFAPASLSMRPTAHTTSTGISTTSTTHRISTLLAMSSDGSESSAPKTFREAEVLGLKFMQEGKYDEALDTFKKGLKLPGSRSDVVRTKLVSGPSPVGGSAGGTESKNVQTLDEFEIQAAYYNMACAQAQLKATDEALAALRTALENGFDNFATVRSDPDLALLQQSSAKEFEALMEEFEPPRGFNPFGLFNKGGK